MIPIRYLSRQSHMLAVTAYIADADADAGLTAGTSRPELAWSGKLALIVMMWAEWLEIVPILALAATLIVAPRRGHNH